MLSIGEFSQICQVSTKTLRYYAEIGLIKPEQINPENGYRYYAIEQLETMLFINRLKSYNFSLDEIKALLRLDGPSEEKLAALLLSKKQQIEQQIIDYNKTLDRMDEDLITLRHGKSIMSYLGEIQVQLVDIDTMYLLSIRKKVHEDEYPTTYAACFGRLFRRIADDHLTVAGSPMVLFHDSEFSPAGLDTEFAVPIKEYVTGTRDFTPGLCLKTVLHGSYQNLPSVYTRQREWAEKEGFINHDALFEVYITDPSQVTNEQDYITEVYYPVKKRPANA